MSSLGEALEYPREHEEWVKTILIGGVLSILGFLLVPIVLVYGYIVRVLKHRLDGDPQPPTFGEWEELLVDGLQVVAIGIVYLLVPILVGFVTVGGSMAAIGSGTQGGAAVGGIGFILGAFLSFVLSLVFGYVAVAAVVNFAHEGRLGAAFDFATIGDILFDGDYAVAWLLSVAVFIGVSILTGILNIIPLLGTVIGAFVFFYAQIAAAHLWAGGYSTARGLGGDERHQGREEPTI